LIIASSIPFKINLLVTGVATVLKLAVQHIRYAKKLNLFILAFYFFFFAHISSPILTIAIASLVTVLYAHKSFVFMSYNHDDFYSYSF